MVILSSFFRFPILLLTLTWTSTFAISIDIVGQIAWNSVLPDITLISPDSRVTIGTRQQDRAFIRRDGSFVLQDVRPGKHVLRVACREVSFLPISIEVSELADESPIVRPYVPGQAPAPFGHSEPQLSYPIRLLPRARLQYVEVRAGFNPISMLLSNPMYLLMGGMAVFMMVMPKIMNMMDPEALAEVQANQANMRKQMASMQDLDLTSGLSKLLASSGGEESSDPSTSKSATSATKSGSNTRRRK
ncbi:hypothetical protein CROQUDRAFT_656024 [Cronartium quercuum f. sp. fusiforme G11]|uniref:ER membrane protein complex subunit 7 beta-sandwich domain-containing protein n=1 Tax=Cronartium quercuum f. sp. fusiforme G11 TaxID=708437 RepID=A0A9P6TE68_9BASI|nr:hypothetical protein CROQUDRAFT_656024 [Cronartium quercuum f. sp. fusiforme G11]